eukprot:scaffold91673_cov32-Tisochrysis_lutea.AAC.3
MERFQEGLGFGSHVVPAAGMLDVPLRPSRKSLNDAPKKAAGCTAAPLPRRRCPLADPVEPAVHPTMSTGLPLLLHAPGEVERGDVAAAWPWL